MRKNIYIFFLVRGVRNLCVTNQLVFIELEVQCAGQVQGRECDYSLIDKYDARIYGGGF